jgi:hypothetical protein
MKRKFKIASFAALVFIAGTLYGLPATAQARSLSNIKYASFNVFTSIREGLRNYLNKDVVIYISSGKNFQGYVKNVCHRLILLE